MKNFSQILLALILLVSTSCSYKAFEPTAGKNPWADDYRTVSAMKNYKEWGTYNVHDPSCLLIGDTYYMYSTDAIFGENKKEIQESRQ